MIILGHPGMTIVVAMSNQTKIRTGFNTQVWPVCCVGCALDPWTSGERLALCRECPLADVSCLCTGIDVGAC
jgi:hypothetical protein